MKAGVLVRLAVSAPQSGASGGDGRGEGEEEDDKVRRNDVEDELRVERVDAQAAERHTEGDEIERDDPLEGVGDVSKHLGEGDEVDQLDLDDDLRGDGGGGGGSEEAGGVLLSKRGIRRVVRVVIDVNYECSRPHKPNRGGGALSPAEMRRAA